jgi:hypothetical protein
MAGYDTKKIIFVIASAAKQSSLPRCSQRGYTSYRRATFSKISSCGTEDWIASLRSQ